MQLRRIEAHREAGAEKEIRRIYKNLLKDLKQFIGYEYAELAEDGKLTYDILQRKGEYARFLEEVEQRVSGFSPALSKEIRQLVSDTYQLSYQGIVDAVSKSKNAAELQAAMQGLRAVQPEVLKQVVDKGLIDDVLKKNWQAHIYDIKRNIVIGLANGDRVDTMAKRIAQCVNTDYKKAIRIARTETHRAQEAGHCDGAQALDNTLKQGVSGQRMVKIWKTMRDKRVRDTHGPMEGVTILVDETFTLPSDAITLSPSNSGNPAEDINCRCYLSYDLMSDEEYYKATGKHFDS